MKWLPLPKIAHGIAIYPFSPSNLQQQQQVRPFSTSSGLLSPTTPTASTSTTNDDSSIHTIASSSSSSFTTLDQSTSTPSAHHVSHSFSTNAEDYSHLIALEVGDELFIIEQQGQWYRGYVLCALEQGRKPNKAPIGIFPRSHVSIKEYVDIDPDEADTLVYRRRREISTSTSSSTSHVHQAPPTTTSGTESRPISEIPSGLPRSFSESFINQQSHISLDSLSNSFVGGRPGSFGDLNFDLSVVNETPAKKNTTTSSTILSIPPPPLPLARFDQSTITGNSEPLVDEIAACVSEWNSLLYTYINHRQYNTFNTVRDHINYLFQARRQLLDQALSREELIKLRKEIIYRMVVSNLEQHQEMIIRHPEKGYLLDATNASLSTIYRMHWKYATLASSKFASTGSPKLIENSGSNDSTTATPTSTTTATTSTNTNGTTTPILQNTPNQQQQQQQQQPKGAKFYHLFFELKACVAHICQVGEFTELYFALYSASEKKFLTEQFVVILNYNGMPKDETQIGKLQALFVDLSQHDLADNLYLVCHVVRLGGMKLNEKEGGQHFAGLHAPSLFHSNKHTSFQRQNTSNSLNAVATANNAANICRRPFGCAVLKLTSLLQDPSSNNSNTSTSATSSTTTTPSSAGGPRTTTNDPQTALEHDMPIYTAISESNYTTLHEDIIFGNTKEYQKNPRAEMLRISLRTFYGFLDEVLKTNVALLQDIPHTLRLGFADVVFPDDSRNELYIKLESGDLSQLGGKTRNIQVTMCVRDNRTGEVIENAISMGAGARPVSYWESMVMYHEQRPKWGELIKINISDASQWERSHVFLTVKHRSSSSSSSSAGHHHHTHSGGGSPMMIFANTNSTTTAEPGGFGGAASSTTSVTSNSSGGNEKIIAMGFLPLFLPPLHRDFVADGIHTLHIYKYDRHSSLPRSYLDTTPWCARSSAPSNMLQQNMEYLSRVRSPPPPSSQQQGVRKLGHHHSPSSHSFKSTGSFTSIINHPTSASTSASDITALASTSSQQQISASASGNSKLSLLRDTVTLSTFLCSNQFTQNKTLVKLLNWRTLMEGTEDGTAELLSVLDQFTFVGEVEVVKFLSDIFDALLDILVYQDEEEEEEKDEKEQQYGESGGVTNNSNEVNDAVLAAIIWLLGIVQDRRFSNFRPVLDVYIENRFSIQDYERHYHQQFTNSDTPNYSYRPAQESTFQQLLKSLTRLCENPTDPTKAKLLRSSMKVWDYLFRFIVRSRLNQQQKEDDQERAVSDPLYKRNVEQLVSAITNIMSPEQPSSMIGTQTLTLQHFADILEELLKIFSPPQVVEIAVHFVDACSHVTGRLVGFKLAMILNIVKGSTFNDPSCRLDLAKNVFRWIRLWVNSYGSTAKDVIFARQVEQQQNMATDVSHAQTRLPRGQWIENLRLSLTIISEVLDKVRRSFGMTSSGLSSSSISSPSFSNYSRPTSFATNKSEDDLQDFNQSDLNTITEVALQLVPQLLNAYKDLQKMTIQAIHVSSAPSASSVIDTTHAHYTFGSSHNSRPHSRQSFSILRERASSIGGASNTGGTTGKNPTISQDILQELKAHHASGGVSTPGGGAGGGAHGINTTKASLPTSVNGHHHTTMSSSKNTNSGSNNSNKSKFTVVLQALATSPVTPFPSTYPFQPGSRSVDTSSNGLTNDHAAMISTGLLDLTVIFLELFYLTPKQQWVNFIKKMYEQDGLGEAADFLRKVVYTCMGILFGDSIMTLEESSLSVDAMARAAEDEHHDRRKLPHNWLNLTTISHQIVMCQILEPIKAIFEIPAFTPTEKVYMAPTNAAEKEHVDGTETVTETLMEEEEVEEPLKPAAEKNRIIEEQRSALLLWRIYFVGFLRVVGSSKLELSEFMPQVQRAVWKIAGNMRGEVGAKLFLSLWQLAGRSVENNREDSNRSALQSVTTDYFGNDFAPSLTSNHSPITTALATATVENNYFSDDSLRKSMASIEEVDDDEHHIVTTPPSTTTTNNNNYSIRNSVRIGPTDEVPLSSIHEENFTDGGYIKSEISFLQADLSYFILAPMCSVSLTLHDRVRCNAISVIADIIAIELYTYGELMHVQHVLISTLDRLVMYDEKGDDTICAKITVELSTSLEQRLQADDRTDLVVTGRRAVDSLCKFLGLLLQIRSLPVDDDEFMDERITATLKLMKFIQVIEREEIYIKYVHQLVQLHLDSRNFIEAALTLRFHADLLRWDPTDKLTEITDLGLSAQSSFSRKEGLCMKMITYLDQGSAWELCIQLCKELAYEYENTLYDYNKLSDILQRQATFAENIVKKERCFTEYFRVGFYGRGFPASNRNRQYIYRGLEWEKMPSFVERMQNRHPNAQLLPSKVSNSMSISEEQLKELESTLDGQYLQITSVTPVPDVDDNACLSNPIVPDAIKKYYNFNNVSKFSFCRPVVREATSNEEGAGAKQPESDFLNLWTEKVDFECEDRFPTIVRRSKIVNSTISVVSPIENAVTAMENKNMELISLEKKYSAYIGRRSSGSTQNININPFSMSLNGAVDAPVNGGVPLYKKAFLSKDYWDKNPDMRQWIHRLQAAIHQQVMYI